jgi:hypothetical protein
VYFYSTQNAYQGGNTMKTLFRLTIVFTILLFACNVWAQGRPQCPTYQPIPGFPDFVLPLPPDSPGACFWSPDPGSISAGTFFYLWDGTNFIVAVSPGLGVNNFTRFNPKGEGFLHLDDKDGVELFVCDQGLDACFADWIGQIFGDPLDDSWLLGSGMLQVNGGSTGAAIQCPFDIRVKGTVADGAGYDYELKAFTTYVVNRKEPAPGDLVPGCTEAVTKIFIDLID